MPRMSFARAAKALATASSIVITTHINPDGDGIGATLALRAALQAPGRTVRVVCPSPVASIYNFLPGFAAIEVLDSEASARRRKPCDVLLSVDCGDIQRLGAVAGWRHGCLINLDHHVAGRPFGDIALVDGKVACTGQQVERLLKAAKIPLDASIATCLYTGLVFDTGRFMHGNTGAAEFRFAARLLATGIDGAAINRQLTYCRTPHDLAIEALGLKRLRIDEDPRLAGIALSKVDIAKAGAPEDWGDLVDIPRSLRGVEIAYLAREQDDGSVRVSLRSNPPVAISPVAQHFDGGGHRQAAGCTLTHGSLRQALADLLPRLRAQLPA